MTSALTLSSFLYFLLFCATVTFSPGPMTLLLLSLGLKDGLRSSIPAQIGASVSYLISILVFAVGFSELIKGNLAITQGIQIVGVAYILYLAYKQWRALPMDMSDESGVRPIGKPLSLVFRGFLVNVSNPKALVFMLAVLPQFINPHAQLLPQYLTITGTMVAVDLFVMAGYTGLAARVLRLLRTPRQQRRMNRTFAGLFLGAATLLATIRRAPV